MKLLIIGGSDPARSIRQREIPTCKTVCSSTAAKYRA